MRLLFPIPAAALALLVAANAGHAEELRVGDVQQPEYPSVQALTHMAQVVNERTHGRYKIAVTFRNESSEQSVVEQVKSGALDLARVNVATFNKTPAMRALSLPFLFESTDHVRRVVDGPIGDEILASLDGEGLVGLCFYDAGSRSFYTSTKPIKRSADLAGLKVRVQPSDVAMATMKAMAAKAMPLSYDRVYTALKAGLIDAAENNLPSYESSRHYEVARVYSQTEHARSPGLLVLSKQVWQRLSAEDQKVMRAAARESVIYYRRIWDAGLVERRRKLDAAGVQFVSDVDRKSFADAAAPVYAEFAADPVSKSLVQRIRAATSIQ
jgi:tripartite ATP-independent transporter DctP family solute receptor